MAEEAQKLKEKGNEAYKARRFEEAIEHYSKAWELNKDIVYLNNLAAVYFEQGNFDTCIETCQKAVDEGRDLRADCNTNAWLTDKVIAKALSRTASAYLRKEDYENAVRFYNKSLTEHRTPDTLTKLKEAEKAKSDAEKKAYINPELAEKARTEGNAHYKMSAFAESVRSYEEAIKRDPSDPRGYTNRASAYLKLLAVNEALKDAETAIKVDPKFAKGYIRKANVKFAMKDYTQAMEALEEARNVDQDGKSSAEISQQERKIMEAQYTQQSSETDEERLQRAARDPEVAQILSDPVMQTILQQAQENPKALMDHLKNEDFRRKIAKLQSAGILKMR